MAKEVIEGLKAYREATLTNSPLFEEYAKILPKDQMIFVNCLVLNQTTQDQALRFAYPRTNEWTALSRWARASALLNEKKNPKLVEYKRKLESYYYEKIAEESVWNKSKAIAKLTGILERVEEELKPQVKEDGSIRKYDIKKVQSDTILGAISELNKVAGLTNSSKVEIDTKQVIFSGEDEIPDGK